MPIVGTAGHVDHGKTALIKALTGIDTDRLPEEKARGMTTDLGFAHFVSPGQGPIGVVDVPGHERFIRNMVAGASSIDGAILVVAADDGWMEQSGRHLEVLRAFGIPVLAIAVTKADLVAPSRSEAVGADAARRISQAYAEAPFPPALAIDALRGTGIPALRDAITAALAALPSLTQGSAASLYVDRVFTLRGPGLVVAGSLRCGPIAKGDELLLLPAGEPVRVRELQSYGKAPDRAIAGSRVALAISRPKADPRRGDRLVGPSSAAAAMLSFYAAITYPLPLPRIRPGTELELAIGTSHRLARAWPSRSEGFLRIVVEEAIAAEPGEPVLFLRSGGADLLASGLVMAKGGETAPRRRVIEEAIAGLGWSEGASWGIDLPRRFEIAQTGFSLLSSGEVAPPGSELAGDFAFSPRRWREASTALLKAISEAGRLPEASLSGKLGLPQDAARALASRLEKEKSIARRDSVLLLPGAAASPSSELPASARNLLGAIRASSTSGYERPERAPTGYGKDLALLCSANLAIGLDSSLFLSRQAYDELIHKLFAGRLVGESFTVPEAKAATGFSRKWILPFLNRVERDGWVRREGDCRHVLSLPPPLDFPQNPPL